jgi:hypothetical protein
MNDTFPLLSDEPSEVDLLAFGAVAQTVADALFDPTLDPVALGLSGSWGSGKTTVLNLVEGELKRRSKDDAKVLVVRTEPWRYDPATGPKETLISEVLSALEHEIKDHTGKGKAILDKLKKLAGRVDWAKAMKTAAKASITLQLPDVDELLKLVREDKDDASTTRGLDQFRTEFADLLTSKELGHIHQVAVLVDDLDRCLPETVVEALEAIRLFLSVEKMSFVIAADEQRVAEAIEQRLHIDKQADSGEDFSTLYLHKIVQTTIPVPALSRFDTESYLYLLMAKPHLDSKVYDNMVALLDKARSEPKGLAEVAVEAKASLADQLMMAEKLTPILYERFRGNPRRIKRFLNDISVRQSIATKRGIDLPAPAVAKLMVIEKLNPGDFETVLGWLSTDTLKQRLAQLDQISRPKAAAGESVNDDAPDGESNEASNTIPGLTDTLIDWAHFPPGLSDLEIASYLHLAAAFAHVPLLEGGLPERLQGLASILTSKVTLDRQEVTDEEIRAIPLADAELLLAHVAHLMRSQADGQPFKASAIIRIAETHEPLLPAAVRAFQQLPGAAVVLGTVYVFKGASVAYATALDGWRAGDASPQVCHQIEVTKKGLK